jgi:hypothetical protein
MPLYIYQNPKTQEVKEIVQSIHDKHEYFENGIKWNRIFTVPQVGIDSKLDANSTEKDFAEKTKNKKDKVGDLWDRSRELSEKREKLYGKDPVKEKYFKDWSKKRKGKKHPKAGLS